MEKFYMVWVEGTRGSAVTHKDPLEAIREAERLARLPANIGKKVYTLETEGYCQVEPQLMPVVWKNIE